MNFATAMIGSSSVVHTTDAMGLRICSQSSRSNARPGARFDRLPDTMTSAWRRLEPEGCSALLSDYQGPRRLR